MKTPGVANRTYGAMIAWMAVGLATAWLAPGAAHGQASFIGLGVSEGEDANSMAGQVSADGTTVVGTAREEIEVEGETETVRKAFRWTSGGGLVTLPLPETSEYHRGLGVSGDGAIVVGVLQVFEEDEEEEIREVSEKPFRWTSGSGLTTLPMPEGAVHSGAAAISSDGSTVVGFMDSEDGIQAFRWTSGDGTQGLGFFPNGIESRALAVSSDGSVIVGYAHHADGLRAFRWTAQDGLQNLGITQGASASRATGVSADGSIVVGLLHREDRTVRAFRWESQGGMVELVPPANTRAWLATAVSADGSIVVGQMIGEDRSVESFVWDSTNGMRSIRAVLEAAQVDLTDWRLDIAMGISANGLVIVGAGVNPADKGEAWRAVLPSP